MNKEILGSMLNRKAKGDCCLESGQVPNIVKGAQGYETEEGGGIFFSQSTIQPPLHWES